jgi:hypothetical protein
LAGNKEKPLLSFYGTEWKKRGYGLSFDHPAVEISWSLVMAIGSGFCETKEALLYKIHWKTVESISGGGGGGSSNLAKKDP